MSEKGVIVGCDHNQEWLLPWWWENYSNMNSLPVAFADFGMTEVAKKWCEERGHVYPINLEIQKGLTEDHIEKDILESWQKYEKFWYGFWQSRQAWFNKPLALLNSPYETGIWLDVDCQVLGNVKPIFEFIDPITGIALAKEMTIKDKVFGKVHYNSGVIAFNREAPILKKWVDNCIEQNHLFIGDDFVLTKIIEEGYQVGNIPSVYNCLMGITKLKKESPVVLHWIGTWKSYLRINSQMRFLLLKSYEPKTYNEYLKNHLKTN